MDYRREGEELRTKVKTEAFPVRIGNQNILVKFEDILLFCIDGEYVQLVQKNNKKFYCDQSLDKLEKILPPDTFLGLTGNLSCTGLRYPV